jgi:hypothetical protein
VPKSRPAKRIRCTMCRQWVIRTFVRVSNYIPSWGWRNEARFCQLCSAAFRDWLEAVLELPWDNPPPHNVQPKLSPAGVNDALRAPRSGRRSLTPVPLDNAESVWGAGV